MAGVPDDLDRLWTPHRLAYVTGEDRPTTGYDAPSGCPFCLAPQRPADESLVVARGRTVYAVLNLYPYNPGHLMVCPFRHVADYTELEDAESMELAQFIQDAIRVIRRVSGPHGFNVGMNQGRVAGAGITAHLHQHVVPRWGGDTNFMPVIGRTKVLPQLLPETRALLAKAWDELRAESTSAHMSPTTSAPGSAAAAQTPAAQTPSAEATSATARPARARPAKISRRPTPKQGR